MNAVAQQGYSVEAKAEIANHVVSQIAEGRALTRILREDEGMPTVSTFFLWLRDDPDLSEQVERAREIGAATILDEIVNIADESGADVYIEYDKDDKPRAKIDGEAIQRSKLRVYAREKYAQMIAPRRFGNKVDITSDGKELKPGNQLNDNRLQAIVGLVAERKAAEIEAKRDEE